LLRHGVYQRSDASALLVPTLIMAAGQFACGLAWLAVCGEDTPDLIASAADNRHSCLARQDRGGEPHARHGKSPHRASAGRQGTAAVERIPQHGRRMQVEVRRCLTKSHRDATMTIYSQEVEHG
jgi:hypothetical protein